MFGNNLLCDVVLLKTGVMSGPTFAIHKKGEEIFVQDLTFLNSAFHPLIKVEKSSNSPLRDNQILNLAQKVMFGLESTTGTLKMKYLGTSRRSEAFEKTEEFSGELTDEGITIGRTDQNKVFANL